MKLKITILFLLIAISNNIIASEIQDTFFGCKFGISRFSAKLQLIKLGHSATNIDGEIVFNSTKKDGKISFGGVDFQVGVFQFAADKLSRFIIFTELKEKKEAQHVHDYIYSVLEAKHELIYNKEHDTNAVFGTNGQIGLWLDSELRKGKKMYYLTMRYTSLEGLLAELNEL